MATIGLNDGPYLIFTITYDKGSFVIADGAELRIPTFALSQLDTLKIATDFRNIATPPMDENTPDKLPLVVPLTSDIICVSPESKSFKNVKEFLTVYGEEALLIIPENDKAEQITPETPAATVPGISVFANKHGTEYLLTFNKEIVNGKVCTYLQVCNPKFSVKGYFNEGAPDFFDYVVHDLTTSYEQLY